MINTVCGGIPASELGITLPHEHIFLDLSCWWSFPRDEERHFLVEEPVEGLNRDLLIADPYHNRDNLLLDDMSLSVEELLRFKRLGGSTVVDLSTQTIGPYPERLKEAAIRTGLNIIAGTGYYVQRAHPVCVAVSPAEWLAQAMISDLTLGFAGTDIRAGVIGELGTSSPLLPDEKKVLAAAALAHHSTGAPINIHLSIFAKEGHQVLDLLEHSGVCLSFVALSHLDETLDFSYHTSLSKRGCFIEFDCFGSECRFDEDQLSEPTDNQRIDALLALLDSGLEDQLLISQDVCTKMQLHRYGGKGYDHLLANIVPALLSRGITRPTIDKLLVHNTARFLIGRLPESGKTPMLRSPFGSERPPAND